jgi:integrase
VLDWASARNYRSGDNPARWGNHLEHILPARRAVQKTNHFPALPYVEIPAFMTELRAREGIAARSLEFAILTAARTGEVRGARWSEVDLLGKVWTVPAARMKGGKEHRVPFSERAVEILSGLPREQDNDRVFIGAGSAGLSHSAMSSILARMGRANVTVHGFRSTFRDWAAEQTSYANHVVEMALAHTISNAVEAAYRRGDLFDKRRRLMSDWAAYCAGTDADNNVVPMRAG